MEASYKPHIRRLAQVARQLPLVTSLIRTVWTRMLFLVKSAEGKKDTLT
jgi:hypothetical protein